MNDTILRKTEPARLGGGWFHSTELLEGEEVLRETEVFHKPSRSTKGGKLYLTNKRLVYLPDRWSAVVGDDRVDWSLESIEDVGLTREGGGILFQINSLLVFECLYVQRPTGRHLFSTGLSLTDREWVAAIKAAMGAGAAPAPTAAEAADDTPGAAQPSDEPAAQEPASSPGASDG